MGMGRLSKICYFCPRLVHKQKCTEVGGWSLSKEQSFIHMVIECPLNHILMIIRKTYQACQRLQGLELTKVSKSANNVITR